MTLAKHLEYNIMHSAQMNVFKCLVSYYWRMKAARNINCYCTSSLVSRS